MSSLPAHQEAAVEATVGAAGAAAAAQPELGLTGALPLVLKKLMENPPRDARLGEGDGSAHRSLAAEPTGERAGLRRLLRTRPGEAERGSPLPADLFTSRRCPAEAARLPGAPLARQPNKSPPPRFRGSMVETRFQVARHGCDRPPRGKRRAAAPLQGDGSRPPPQQMGAPFRLSLRGDFGRGLVGQRAALVLIKKTATQPSECIYSLYIYK